MAWGSGRWQFDMCLCWLRVMPGKQALHMSVGPAADQGRCARAVSTVCQSEVLESQPGGISLQLQMHCPLER
jgi:hypothetical protein